MKAFITYDCNGATVPMLNRVFFTDDKNAAFAEYARTITNDYGNGNLSRVYGDGARVRCRLFLGDASRPALTNTVTA